MSVRPFAQSATSPKERVCTRSPGPFCRRPTCTPFSSTPTATSSVSVRTEPLSRAAAQSPANSLTRTVLTLLVRYPVLLCACTGGPEFTAHSCDPNAYFMFVGDAVTLVSIKDIGAGELISFNYCTTEWDMAEKFPCACKSPQCFGWIKGFAHCTPAQRDIIAPHLSPFIKGKWLEVCTPHLCTCAQLASLRQRSTDLSLPLCCAVL
jgi:hypothetical protein